MDSRMTLDEAKQLLREALAAANTETQESSKDGLALSERGVILYDRYRRLGCELASYPYLREHMWCWMVDVIGTTSEISEEDVQTFFVEVGSSSALVTDLVAKAGGAMVSQLVAFLEDNGFHPTDRGGGTTSWHVGVPCNHSRMEAMTAAVHARFAKAISAGLIKVQIKFWGWSFIDDQ